MRRPALIHIIGALIALGYAQNYYFHLRMFSETPASDATNSIQATTRTTSTTKRIAAT
jgi:hypothetical protein